MKFEKSVRVRTPDGVDHESVEAAHKHMFALNFGTLGNAVSKDFADAVAFPQTEDKMLIKIREALRDVYLAAWPRASKGVPRGARTPATEPATTTEPPAPETSGTEDKPPAAESDKPTDGEPVTAGDGEPAPPAAKASNGRKR